MSILTKPFGYLGLLTLLTLTACSKPTSAPSMGSLLGDNLAGYTKVDKSRPIVFPQDHLSHDDFRQEWWYLTANLKTKQGERIGLQWTQFRIALAPDKADSQSTLSDSDWNTNQIFMTHAAMTSKGAHFAEERWSRRHPRLADVSHSPLTIKIDNWQWTGQDEALFPAQLEVDAEKFGYQLSLETNAPYQLQGEKGYSIKSADGSVASHYYSQPFIKVSGTVNLDGIEHQVSGNAWLDREWSSQFLNKAQAGWDWFALRLSDGSTLMLFQLRGQTDQQPSFYSGRRMFADGSGRNIASKDIQLKVASWHTIDSVRYPVAWQITIASEDINIHTQALNPAAKVPLSVSYWEGPVIVSGSHEGEGYMELTGYD
ncbi:carotenoid 1,2-hydratase [Shewanella eurypsychrophilus]|uniref:Carotenoid 1,2-hydratase n=1 Tax=Shewanella eurypsychrophilus TaxID=2593656 RepID=A0ABX6V7X0_9GAMM|nr:MULTISPECIES: lipocalin-like domain-containing protein [Shewanella]QFU21325.1 carotenoid 1,2-hydratase [Shewanella sp. YLB-09]QPG56615.1 carotenoid 1,2-hydratase [Shewanella eurypsychrophilus]